MQLRQSQLSGDRPICPAGQHHKVHGHGGYDRLKHPAGTETFRVQSWNCTQCSFTFTVIPNDALPYRPISTDLLEAGFEATFSDKDPPLLRENEKGCLNRAHDSFIRNIPFLTNMLGQIVETTCPCAAQLWKELCKLGNLKGILLYLARHFKTSLLKDYKCLKPFIRGKWGVTGTVTLKSDVPQTC